MVELLSGMLAFSIYLMYGLSYETLVYYVFTATLIVITFIDLDHRIIPDIISLPGIPIFFFASFLAPSVTYIDALLGILVGGGSLYLCAWGYHAVTGKEGMGGGDIKLLAMIGALLGWKGVFFTIFVSSVVGTIIGFIVMFASRKDLKLAVPFGPFLSIGAICYIYFGPQIINWYFNWGTGI
jgi:leader peptidase (prepilin peptidase)/N-methyltransferase